MLENWDVVCFVSVERDSFWGIHNIFRCHRFGLGQFWIWFFRCTYYLWFNYRLAMMYTWRALTSKFELSMTSSKRQYARHWEYPHTQKTHLLFPPFYLFICYLSARQKKLCAVRVPFTLCFTQCICFTHSTVAFGYTAKSIETQWAEQKPQINAHTLLIFALRIAIQSLIATWAPCEILTVTPILW